MLYDLVNGEILIGKTKTEVIELIDTVDTKKPFRFESNNWMYIVSKPDPVPATVSPVEVLDVKFKNDKVVNVSIRE